jgi:hypothetical protein
VLHAPGQARVRTDRCAVFVVMQATPYMYSKPVLSSDCSNGMPGSPATPATGPADDRFDLSRDLGARQRSGDDRITPLAGARRVLRSESGALIDLSGCCEGDAAELLGALGSVAGRRQGRACCVTIPAPTLLPCSRPASAAGALREGS